MGEKDKNRVDRGRGRQIKNFKEFFTLLLWFQFPFCFLQLTVKYGPDEVDGLPHGNTNKSFKQEKRKLNAPNFKKDFEQF